MTNWPLFWGGLSAASAAVLIYFLAAYRGLAAESNPLTVPGEATP
jgi:hypothetical protein